MRQRNALTRRWSVVTPQRSVVTIVLLNAVARRRNVAMRPLNVELVHPRIVDATHVRYRGRPRQLNSRVTIAVRPRHGQNVRFGRSNSGHRQNA
jgi:hypothetical protein